jgi:hypothetical protein
VGKCPATLKLRMDKLMTFDLKIKCKTKKSQENAELVKNRAKTV